MFDYSDPKLDGEMLQVLKRVADRAKSCNVEPADIVKYLFLERLVNDGLRHIGLHFSQEERKPLVMHLMKCDVDDLKGLADEMVAVLKGSADRNTTYSFSLGERVKKAYPIRVDTAVYTGINKDFSGLALRAANLISSGLLEPDAIRRTISHLPVSDRLDFLTWYGLKYKSGKNISYLAAEEDTLIKLIKKAAGEDDTSGYVYEFQRRQQQQPAESPRTESFARDHNADPMTAEEFKKMRDKMVGRTFAIDKLLEKYRHLLKEEQFDAVEDSLNALRKNIRKLKVATLKDAIEKTAFLAEQNDWFEGADLIRRIADTDEQFVKVANLISRPEEMGKVLQSLEEISGFLRQRAIIRELSARDIDIFNLGFGHMPEIGDAAAKLMEAFNGAANKIDDLVGKLRAELQQQTAPKMAPEVVKTLVKPQDLPLVKALEPEPAPAQPAPSGELVPDTKKQVL
jgi:predicted DNA-binding protein